MFNSKYVKIKKEDWEDIKNEYNSMKEKIKELEANQSEFLMGVVSRQSEEIKKLLRYKEQDDLLYSYEKTCEERLNIINAKKQEIAELTTENERLMKMYQKESNMTSLLASKVAENPIQKCTEYKTVSKFDIHA